LGAAVTASFDENVKMTRVTYMTIARLLRGEGSVKELNGPVAIAKISGAAFRLGIKALLSLMAMISLQLGIMNLLPIPVLDGGHIMILLVEGVVGHDLGLDVADVLAEPRPRGRLLSIVGVQAHAGFGDVQQRHRAEEGDRFLLRFDVRLAAQPVERGVQLAARARIIDEDVHGREQR